MVPLEIHAPKKNLGVHSWKVSICELLHCFFDCAPATFFCGILQVEYELTLVNKGIASITADFRPGEQYKYLHSSSTVSNGCWPMNLKFANDNVHATLMLGMYLDVPFLCFEG